MPENSPYYARKDDLFRLIQSLGRAEKRFFRSYAIAQGGKDARYLKLFDALDGLKRYDEEEFLESRKGKAFHSYFSYTKNYLFNLLLRALSIHHHEQSTAARVRELLQQTEILYHKRLFDLAQSRIVKGLELCREAALGTYAMELLGWFLRIRKVSASADESYEERMRLYEEQFEQLQLARSNLAYEEITDKMLFELRRSGQFRESEQSHPMQALLADPRLADFSLTQNAEQRVNFYFCYATYANAMGDMEEASKYLEKVWFWMEQDQLRIKDRPDQYIMRCNNFFIAWHRTGQFDRSEELIQKLREFKVDKKSVNYAEVQAHLWRVIYFNQLERYWKIGSVQQALELLPEVLEGLKEHASFLTVTNCLGFYFLLACHHYAAGDLSAALDWTNKYLDEQNQCMRVDKHAHVRLFALILHFELQHREALPYFVNSTYRYLKSRKQMYGVEHVFLKYLRTDLLRPVYPADLEQMFAKMWGEMQDLFEDPLEQNALRYFDFSAWLQARVEGRPMIELMKEKVLV